MKLEGEIDPIKYGAMWQKVQNMEKTMNKMETQMEELLELANKSKGGFWTGMAIASALSGIVSFIGAFFAFRN
jgi:predicted PurR-regulated permease PerM